MHGPLSMLFWVFFAAAIGRVFFPGPVLNQVAVYGSLVYYSGRMLFDTTKMVKLAEQQTDAEFDPMRHAMGLYLNVAIIFLDLLELLARSSVSKKKALDDGVDEWEEGSFGAQVAHLGKLGEN